MDYEKPHDGSMQDDLRCVKAGTTNVPPAALDRFNAETEARELLDKLVLQGQWQPIISAALRRAFTLGQQAGTRKSTAE